MSILLCMTHMMVLKQNVFNSRSAGNTRVFESAPTVALKLFEGLQTYKPKTRYDTCINIALQQSVSFVSQACSLYVALLTARTVPQSVLMASAVLQMESFAWGQTGQRTARRRVNKARLSLTDILHEAPRVLQLVSPDDKKALLAVCKSTRRLVHAFANRITLQEDDSLEHLLDTAVGPHLHQLDLHGIKLRATAVPGLTSAPWSALTSLTLCNCGLNGSTISKLAASKCWPVLQHLSLCNNRLSTAAVKAMAGSNWPLLRHLDLSSNKLTASAISQLTQLRWANLEVLDLSKNPYLDSSAIQKLSSGSWPLLKGLAVGGNFGLGLFAQMTASSWPLLETVQINCNYCAPQVVSFAGCWQNVKNLQIITHLPSPSDKFRSFSMPAVSGLTAAEWTNLQTLDLSCSSLGQSGVMQLAHGQWPLLSKLDISQIANCALLTPDDYADFAQGSWPKLTYLSLAHNKMDNDCAMQLAYGDWPLLANIDLSYNNIGADGGTELAVADWPYLEHLCLYENKPECCGCQIARHIPMPTHLALKFTLC